MFVSLFSFITNSSFNSVLQIIYKNVYLEKMNNGNFFTLRAILKTLVAHNCIKEFFVFFFIANAIVSKIP